MKRIQIWSMMILVVMALPIMVACGDDDDNNGASNYTEAEIIELLTGKWEVYGEAKATVYETDDIYTENFIGTYTDNYKGTIKFKANKSIEFNLTDATKQIVYIDNIPGVSRSEFYIEEAFIHNHEPYTVLKKGGKNFISFGRSSNSYAFEIVSLTKNSFMLRLDDDIVNNENKAKPLGHVYMTIVSN